MRGHNEVPPWISGARRRHIYVTPQDKPYWDWAAKEASRLHISLSSFLGLLIQNAKIDGYSYEPEGILPEKEG